MKNLKNKIIHFVLIELLNFINDGFFTIYKVTEYRDERLTNKKMDHNSNWGYFMRKEFAEKKKQKLIKQDNDKN